MVRRSLIAGFLGILGTSTGPVVESLDAQAGQYFGRNKVVYQSFDWEVLKTEHFDVYYYEVEAEAARLLGRQAERWYARLSRVFDHEFRQRQPIVLYADHSDFEQTNTSGQFIDEGTQGFTEILKRRLVMPMMVSLSETDHLLGHELVHAFQFDITGQGTGGPSLDIPGAMRLPLWFIEGMAEYLSIGPIDPFTTMWMRDALDLEDGFPNIPDLNDPQYFPYRYGHAVWSYLGGTFGDEKIGQILNLAGRTGDPFGSIEMVLEVPINDLSNRWRNETESYFAEARNETQSPDAYGRRVVYEPEGEDGILNLGPAISPDGDEIIYMSERDLFSIEMFLADAHTGEVKRRLTKNMVDPHFESLQFVSSAGEWNQDGRHFVVAGVSGGDAVISVLDVLEGGKIAREVRLNPVGEAYTPTWSPDGTRVAFTGHQNGYTDLYIVDLETEDISRLTTDKYADLQPSWSPDGRYLAFTTDRFTTDLELLVAGPYQIALYDLETGDIQALPGFDDQFRNFNPQWSPEGQNLYFVSDHDGISNLYRLDMATRELHLITDLWTGVSGLSSISPAISVAKQTGEVAFSVNKGGPFSYEIYVIDDPQVLVGEPAPEMLVQVDASVIPPVERISLDHPQILQNARLGLVDPITFEDADYQSSLGLDFVSNPTLAFGASDFGTFFAAGASVYWSDLMGNKTLQTLLNINTSFGNILQGTAALVGYENLSSRWNWAVIGGQVPMVLRQFGYQAGTYEGRQAIEITELRFFEINRQITGIVAYPFNRNSRVEFSGSARQLDFAANIERYGTDRFTGELLFQEQTDLPRCESTEIFYQSCAPQSLLFGTASAALVYDSSIYGGTSPMMGQRFRLEVEPAMGSLNFVTMQADLRRYFRIKPFTLAGRALHVGRWGVDGSDGRLGRMYLGMPQLVRGYQNTSFDARIECQSPAAQTGFFNCPVIEQLIGSRIAVGNIELRLPLIGGIGVISAPGAPPVEIGAFYDVGKAWSTTGDPNCQGQPCSFGDRDWVASAGLLVRANLFGFAIGEIDFVRPFGRPDKNWMWQFSLSGAGF